MTPDETTDTFNKLIELLHSLTEKVTYLENRISILEARNLPIGGSQYRIDYGPQCRGETK